MQERKNPLDDIYLGLAGHLEKLIMGYPFNPALLDLLKDMFSPREALVATAIPNTLLPFEVVDPDMVASRARLPAPEVSEILSGLARRHLLYTAQTSGGRPGYALLQVGYGFPQTFTWAGGRDEYTERMSRHVVNYFNIPTTHKVYGGMSTKPYKYAPAQNAAIAPLERVLPCEQIGPIVEAASRIAVAHCPCRMSAAVLGRACPHSLEVCLKYDELAEYVMDHGLARAVSKDEALHILRRCEEEGLVHMVDNAQQQIKHTCNCCGDYCWNVGIIRRRKIPRDDLMAVYFIRETLHERCTGCNACAEICPVSAVKIADQRAQIDLDWCIGCGVCAGVCPAGAITIKRRIPEDAPESLEQLHRQIRQERNL
ncbi:MAG: 4Fe-4S binding protein [Desulfobacterales bacterium]|nr:4Fe-4S binding protein [Desulfobacterales bacterium]